MASWFQRFDLSLKWLKLFFDNWKFVVPIYFLLIGGGAFVTMDKNEQIDKKEQKIIELSEPSKKSCPQFANSGQARTTHVPSVKSFERLIKEHEREYHP